MTLTRKKLLLGIATLALAMLTIGGASATAVAKNGKAVATADCAAECPKTKPCDQPCQPCPDCPLSSCPKRAH